jgi:hypothetical protein
MTVTPLRLANRRAMEAAESHFQPGFNGTVSVNGVVAVGWLNQRLARMAA